MRLSGLVIAAVLFVFGMVSYRTDRVEAAPVFSSSSSSGGGHSGGSAGSASSPSSASSHSSSSSSMRAPSTGSASSHRLGSSKEDALPEKKSSRSFFHPFRKAKPLQSAEFKPIVPCLKQPCAVPRNACSSRQPWNGFGCGTEGWFNDCRVLAEELIKQQRQMRVQYPGQGLRRQLMLNQYDNCAKRFALEPFGSYLFSDARLFDVP
jgi:hypothetical protein